jgi:hypothetical protein
MSTVDIRSPDGQIMYCVEQDKSLSAVVRDYLIEFAGGETENDRRKRLQKKTIESIRSFKAKDRLARDKAHDRDALR